MPDKKQYLIVLAALLHDVGKLFERGEIFKEARKDPEFLKVCPENKEGGYSTHLHAVHTAAFCLWLEQRFACLNDVNANDWKTWCAAHHKDSEAGDEASVIRISDRLSSSERDEGNYYRRDIHRKTFLEPVLERVRLKGFPDGLATRYRYPLTPLVCERQSLFPAKADQLQETHESLILKEMDGAENPVADPSHWCHLVAEDSAPVINAYRQMGQGLMEEIEALSRTCPDMTLSDLLTCLTTLLERYTGNVPSATNLRHPDISLFDHLRTTAAIAQSLYLYHEYYREQTTERFPVAISDKDERNRWLLVCGDFSGIQKFIYNLTNKGAAKGLRGRSFYVSHFCRICADYLTREMGLTRAALLYNSGGKFYLLIPAHLKEKLYAVRSWVNERLLETFAGDVFFGLGCAEVNARMFSGGNMDKAWENAALDLAQDRLIRFRDNFSVDGFFEPQVGDDPSRPCRICGSIRNCRDIKMDDDTTLRQCRECGNMERLGSVIADTEAIVTLQGDSQDAHRFADDISLQKNRLFSFEKLKVHYLMVPAASLEKMKGCRFSGDVTFLNESADRSFDKLPLPNAGVTGMYLGKWAKNRRLKDDNRPWDFSDYAENAKGIKRLGVLRMDVDNLGLIFIRGLEFPKRQDKGWGGVAEKNGQLETRSMASISRMVTLSRQLNHFFSGYLPVLLERQADFDKCQIIYAGGDDLFIIGSWDQLPGLAETIRSEFKAFCCMNPVFSISGGLTLQRGKYPIYKGAQVAGQSEKKAKDIRKLWDPMGNDFKKDGFCFLGVALPWQDFEMVRAIKQLLESDMTGTPETMGEEKHQQATDDIIKQTIRKNRGLLSFLSATTARNVSLVKYLQKKEQLSIPEAWEKIACYAWRWRTAYQLRRRYGRETKKIEKWSKLIFGNTLEDRKSVLPVYSWLEMPLRWTEFLNR